MMEKIAEMIRKQRHFWGTHIFQADCKTSSEKCLEIYRGVPDGDERSLVGRLSQEKSEEKSEFVFRYDPDYHQEPISDFPSLDKEYRAKDLWPFFSARIPPTDREDIREAIEALNIQSDQPLEILGKVARLKKKGVRRNDSRGNGSRTLGPGTY